MSPVTSRRIICRDGDAEVAFLFFLPLLAGLAVLAGPQLVQVYLSALS